MIVGHYTQVVWKHTQRVGAARLVVDVSVAGGKPQSRYVILIANYDPPGNRKGESPF